MPAGLLRRSMALAAVSHAHDTHLRPFGRYTYTSIQKRDGYKTRHNCSVSFRIRRS